MIDEHYYASSRTGIKLKVKKRIKEEERENASWKY